MAATAPLRTTSSALPALSLTCLLLQLGTLLLPASAAAVKRRAFATSIAGTGNLQTWPGSGGLAGLAAGDSICRARAQAGGLPNASSYRAWLSTAGTDAYCHVQGLSGKKATGCNGAPQVGGGPWYLANGITPFTGPLTALTGARRVIYRSTLLDEFGTPTTDFQAGWVWTGTGAAGVATPEFQCSGWTSSAGRGETGSALGTRDFWTDYSSRDCAYAARLLCFEPGASEAAPPRWASPGALVFVTSVAGPGELGSWPAADGEQGIAAGDTICRNLAGLARLPAPQEFVAWLSTDASDARDRLQVDGPFRRLDGLTVAFSRADLLDGSIRGSIHQDETGEYAGGCDRVWTATAGNGTRFPWSCANWMSSSADETAGVGGVGFERVSTWTDLTGWGCDASLCLYCFANVVTLFWDGFEYTGDASRWSRVIP